MQYSTVTVCVSAYNSEAFIDEALESIVAQTYPNLELVIVDDGSSDDTYARIESFVERHRGRFSWVYTNSRPNKGVVETFNELLHTSRTEWLFFCHADDVQYPDRIKMQYAAIDQWNEPELAMVWSKVDWIDEESNAINSPSVLYPQHGIHRDAYLDLLLVNTVYGGSTLRRAAVIESGGFEAGLPFEDWNMWLKLAARYPIGFVADTAFKYRRHENNSSSTANFSLVLYGILITMGDFIAEHGDIVPEKIKKICLRKNLLRTLHWAQKSRPYILPVIAGKLIAAKFRRPRPDSFYDLAELIEQSFHGNAARRYAGLVATRRK